MREKPEPSSTPRKIEIDIKTNGSSLLLGIYRYYRSLRNLVTSKQFSLCPARSDDRGAPLARFQLGARGMLQFGQRIRAEVRQRMALEPRPQVFDRIEADSGEMHSGDDRDVIPVETELHHRALALHRPGANPRGTLRQARFVDEDDQPPLSAGFFLSPGQVRFFQCSMATASRSSARRSGFWLENPSCPSRRQT